MKTPPRFLLVALPLIAVFYLMSLGCGRQGPDTPEFEKIEGVVVDVNDARPRDGGVVIELKKVDWSTVILWVGSPYADPPPPPLSDDLQKSLLALRTGDRVRATGRPGDGNLQLTGLEIIDRGGGSP
jgi:hypothetical protein